MFNSLDQLSNIHTFVFQNLTNHTSQTVLCKLIPYDTYYDLKPILDAFKFKNNISSCRFQAYDPPQNKFINIYEPYKVNLLIGLLPTIIIKFYCQQKNKGSQFNKFEDIRKQRNKQRTIRQVIKSVKQWRQLHQDPQNKLNLQQAAQCVGISKKSLDDYFCQLRLGEKYGFNFQNHLDDKIGILRTFVKKNRSRIDQKFQMQKNHQKLSKYMLKIQKNQKHPKKLKIIEEKSRISIKKAIIQQKSNSVSQTIIDFKQQIQQPYFSSMESSHEEEFENQFYRCFSLIANEPQDPFVPFKQCDFRPRKNYNQQQAQFQW